MKLLFQIRFMIFLFGVHLGTSLNTNFESSRFKPNRELDKSYVKNISTFTAEDHTSVNKDVVPLPSMKVIRNYAQSPDFNKLAKFPFVNHDGNFYAFPLTSIQSSGENLKKIPHKVTPFVTYAPVINNRDPSVKKLNGPVVYKTETSLPHDKSRSVTTLRHAKSTNERLGIDEPFFSKLRPGYAEILPVRSATSTAQFPRYYGASVSLKQNNNYVKPPEDYQDFQTQSQLHFDNDSSLGRIKSDVEVIDKSKPIPPLSRDNEGERSNEDSSCQ